VAGKERKRRSHYSGEGREKGRVLWIRQKEKRHQKGREKSVFGNRVSAVGGKKGHPSTRQEGEGRLDIVS